MVEVEGEASLHVTPSDDLAVCNTCSKTVLASTSPLL